MTIYILCAEADQSMAIARILRESGCAHPIVGVRGPARSNRTARVYDSLVNVDALSRAGTSDLIVPTNAHSTEDWLYASDCTVGSIVHRRQSLRVFDKEWLLSRAAEVGVPVPVSWASAKDIEDSEFPIFFKERRERGGGVRGLAQLRADLPESPSRPLIFQTYIESAGTYGVAFLASNGRIQAVHSHFERESYPETGGSSVFIETFHHPRLLLHTERLIEHIHYSGWGLAEYKFDKNIDDFILMEINAKFWASCEFTLRSEPEFMQQLFGIQIKARSPGEMVFLNRALARGLVFILMNFRSIKNSEWVVYPGLVRASIPRWLVRRFRRPNLKSPAAGVGTNSTADGNLKRQGK